MDPKLRFLHRDKLKQLHCTFTARGAYKCEKYHLTRIFTFQAILCFLESRCLLHYIKFDKSVFFLLHYIVCVESRKWKAGKI